MGQPRPRPCALRRGPQQLRLLGWAGLATQVSQLQAVQAAWAGQLGPQQPGRWWLRELQQLMRLAWRAARGQRCLQGLLQGLLEPCVGAGWAAQHPLAWLQELPQRRQREQREPPAAAAERRRLQASCCPPTQGERAGPVGQLGELAAGVQRCCWPQARWPPSGQLCCCWR